MTKLRSDNRPLSFENLVALAHATELSLATLLSVCLTPQQTVEATSEPGGATATFGATVNTSLNPAYRTAAVEDAVQDSGRVVVALNAIQEQYRARAQARVLARMECNRAFGTDVGEANRVVLTVGDMSRVDRLVLQKQQLSRLLESPEATIERLPAVHCVLSVYPSVDVRTFEMDLGHVEELPRQEFSPNSATDRRQPPCRMTTAALWFGWATKFFHRTWAQATCPSVAAGTFV